MDPGKRTFYLGRYNCIEQLGTGPIGETYRAKIYGVAGFEKQFAVKRLHPHLSEDEAFVARFVQAASAFAALEHPQIVRVHEVNAQGAHYYIVADLVRGLDLRRLLDLLQHRGEALAADAAMTIAVDVAEALEYAHGKTNILPGGVLHLGLTAPSVMVTYEGDVKLIDVGLLAAFVREGWSADDALTPTLSYLAPETWRGQGIDARADVFSLGVVLHELLGGSRVFLSDRADELRRAIENGPPPPPPADGRLQEIVTRALQPDRERRFASVAEMRAAILAILGARAERARNDLSAVVRRLAMPREKRTGAFAAVVLPPAVSGLSTPIATTPPPIPSTSPPRAWSPPTAKPPAAPTISAPPHYNTLAGIGPEDQALVPIELIELPGKPTEKGMATVHPDDAETNRFAKSDAQELAGSRESLATIRTTTPSVDEPAKPPETAVAGAHARGGSSDSQPGSEPSVAATNGHMAAPAPSAPEASWTPPAMAPPPAPSPVPVFAPPSNERPEPVEPPARSSVPSAPLRPRSGTSRAVLGVVVLLVAASGLAIWAGLGNGDRQTGDSTAAKSTTPVVAALSVDLARASEDLAQLAAVPQDLGSPVAIAAKAAQPAAAAAMTTGQRRTQAAAPAAPTAAPPSAAPTTAAPTTAAAGMARSAAASPEGTFEVVTTPAGAALFVDGEPRGTTPAQLSVAAGAHKLVIAGEGQKLVKREVTVTPGGRLELTLEAAKLPPSVAGGEGLKVRCKTRGEVRLYVDGEDSGRSCPNEERISVTAGPHKIGLYSPRTDEMHEVEQEVAQGNNSTRVYVKY
ncbi:MAG: serine/threonine protein kinase [Myxococcales bacterium]|nr:serine/threonine protein kinase [Myxococcales bacterium]